MSECQTINCPTCGLKLEETFVEQKCPRCQSIIESKFVCGSCHTCNDSLHTTEGQTKENPLHKFLSLFSKK